MATQGPEGHIELVAKWSGQEYAIIVKSDETVQQLKLKLEGATKVLTKRQKLIGLGKGKLPDDDVVISALGLKHKHKFIMMGTTEEDILPEPKPEDMPDVLNDFDYDYYPDQDALQKDIENQKKLQHRIQNTEITLIRPLRTNKKLLVLDLDYTLFDMKSTAANLLELKRPFVDEMLVCNTLNTSFTTCVLRRVCLQNCSQTAVFPHYDIAVWSQTSWKWLEIKLTELGLLTHPNFHISFVMDRNSMFSVTSKVRGEIRTHEVKALQIIWAKLPQYSAKNTIHIDDLGRNFAMNPQSGLKISPYKNAPTNKNVDRELQYLTRYLLAIAAVDDLTTLKHDVCSFDHAHRANYHDPDHHHRRDHHH